MTNANWGFALLALSAAAAAVELPPMRSVAAVGGAYGINGRPDDVVPVPAGDWCDECTPGGKPLFPDRPGYVGDGVIFTICGACDGTQKRKTDLEETEAPEEPDAPQIAPSEPTAPPAAHEAASEPMIVEPPLVRVPPPATTSVRASSSCSSGACSTSPSYSSGGYWISPSYPSGGYAVPRRGLFGRIR